MGNIKTLLENRFKKPTSDKMESLAKKRLEGELSPFLNGFTNPKLSSQEEAKFRQLLEEYSFSNEISKHDLQQLCHLSAQVKQIHHQAVLLHGERIKKVRELLTSYREGAFSAWLLLTYGNRQTPYNFLVYYELFSTLPDSLKLELEKLPRQAVYTLAAREGTQEKKEAIIRNYQGETKGELLEIIRKEFPLLPTDRRHTPLSQKAFTLLAKGTKLLRQCTDVSHEELIALEKLIKKLQKVTTNLLSNTKVSRNDNEIQNSRN
ncbi:Virulence plasmid protein pGP6-D-related protein [Chlamydia muridarum str. Nigg]|uniref:Virulence plasmid protein pGP6-D-related protein n=2 Tax=Chlamydia muridarum TaxID=83560 RepID=GP6R_CHLMU|nr:pGP6-D family virulence protein [Chlamydia muridarum]Q9PJF7.1 RecName: Full=Virulence plasmid protein pGP6-D-related protein [Chlamydia muridarum str. Nigg]UFT54364.1 Virulence plasmid protein pGP6-D-related protein [Chlamydia trachomatis]AAF39668.1 virulence protein pGP6-D-related protein [Chlamydia muridarum str. Nigg]AHH23258.1 virulence factor [Chlamydia muridarum str. Nigg3 CMUT3-5]AHH24184.1 virulence factor [Chlamydia muridarum str. Nigg CM972]AID38384.1 virulence factor [Chlamydia 